MILTPVCRVYGTPLNKQREIRYKIGQLNKYSNNYKLSSPTPLTIRLTELNQTTVIIKTVHKGLYFIVYKTFPAKSLSTIFFLILIY